MSRPPTTPWPSIRYTGAINLSTLHAWNVALWIIDEPHGLDQLKQFTYMHQLTSIGSGVHPLQMIEGMQTSVQKVHQGIDIPLYDLAALLNLGKIPVLWWNTADWTHDVMDYSLQFSDHTARLQYYAELYASWPDAGDPVPPTPRLPDTPWPRRGFYLSDIPTYHFQWWRDFGMTDGVL